MAWYDLDEKNNQDFVIKQKYDQIIAASVGNLSQLIKQLRTGDQYRFITEKSFNAISVIEYLLQQHKIAEIYISIYRMNDMAVNKIINYINDGIFVNIIVSNFFRENKKYEAWARKLLSIKADNYRCSFALNHTKIFICRTNDDRYFVFEGSGNMSDNSRLEQYLFEENKTMYEFHKSWMLKILDNGNK